MTLRLTCLIALLCTFSIYSFANPTNDECSGAVLLTVNNDANCAVTYTGTLENATQSMAPCIATAADAKDVWFKFVATASTHRITVDPLGYRDMLFEVFSGTCGSLTSIACVNSGLANEEDVVLLNGLIPGNTYYIRVFDFYGNTPQSDFIICINSATALINNDECSAAIEIPVGSVPDLSVDYGTYGATQSMPGCNGSAEDDIWFKFTATSTRHLLWVTTGSNSFNPVVEVFAGSCGSLTPVGCYTRTLVSSDVDAYVLGLTPGATYYYRVYGKPANNPRITVSTSVVTLPNGPANDECTDAVLLTVNNDASCAITYTGTRDYATESLPPCVTTGSEAEDVWFKFVATASTHRIMVDPVEYMDLLFEVFSGSCGNLSSLACVNSGSLGEEDVALLSGLVPGNTYYIRVFDKYGNNQQSGFTICISSANSLIANDECSGAITIPVNSVPDLSADYGTLGATQSMPGCSGSSEEDIWFKFTATGTRHLIWVTTTNDWFNPVVEVFTGNCGALTSLGCYTRSDPFNSDVDADLLGLTPGTTYYYRVYGKPTGNARAMVSTSVITMPAVPANDECAGAVLLTVNNDASCAITYTGNQEFATQSMAPCIATGSEAKDVWFKFVATAGTHRITVDPVEYRDVLFEVFSGTCGGLTSLACVNSGELNEQDVVLLSGLTAGNTYYIRVFDKYANTTQSEFIICINSTTSLIENDECGNAIEVPVGSVPDFSADYGTLGATQSMPGCNGSAEEDIWFKFTATGTRHTLWVTTTNDWFNPVVEVFTGSCGALLPRGCYSRSDPHTSDVDVDLTGLTPGTTYYYRVYGKPVGNARAMVSTSLVANVALPVTGLNFKGHRVNEMQVLLQWKTVQEMQNKGFGIERKLPGQSSFTYLRFENSKAIGGNSTFPLSYQWIDNNSFTGTTYYRLRQEDTNGQYEWSSIIAVNSQESKAVTLKVWPNPGSKYVKVRVDGIKEEILQVYNVYGKIVKQITVQNNIEQQINDLLPGIYIIRLAGHTGILQKVIIQ